MRWKKDIEECLVWPTVNVVWVTTANIDHRLNSIEGIVLDFSSGWSWILKIVEWLRCGNTMVCYLFETGSLFDKSICGICCDRETVVLLCKRVHAPTTVPVPFVLTSFVQWYCLFSIQSAVKYLIWRGCVVAHGMCRRVWIVTKWTSLCSAAFTASHRL